MTNIFNHSRRQHHLFVSTVGVMQYYTAEAVQPNRCIVDHEREIVDELGARLEPVCQRAARVQQYSTGNAGEKRPTMSVVPEVYMLAKDEEFLSHEE